MKAFRKLDVGVVLILLLLPLVWFGGQVVGGKTLLPADNIFAFQPWQSYAQRFHVSIPHNLLISDLILENYPWKTLIVEALHTGQFSGILWNPRAFAGSPFLAAGQHSALYPFSVIFYLLPLWRAYGIFTWLQLGLAGLCMYAFARILGQLRPAAAVAAIAYACSLFFIVSVNFTMIIAAAAWLPLILAIIEIVVRKQEQKGAIAYSPAPYIATGAILMGLQVLAGHIEITYYVLIVSAFYAIWRLFGAWRRLGAAAVPPARRARLLVRLAAWLVVMAVLGLAIGAVQLIPLLELVSQSFRQGSTTLQQVRDWAWPARQIITFLLPNFFGNPTHHQYFDIWTRMWAPVTHNALGEPLNTIDWGVKNYVEGANYLGLPTLLLATLAAVEAVAAVWRWVAKRTLHSQALLADRSRTSQEHLAVRSPHHVLGFAILALLSLLFAFGTPLYAALYYLLPGYSQLHSAFRWVYPYTLSMAVLAGYGMDVLLRSAAASGIRKRARLLAWIAVGGGLVALALVAVSLFVPGPFVAFGNRLLAASDLARTRGFADGAMTWSYEAAGLAQFGFLAVLAGTVVLWGVRRGADGNHAGLPEEEGSHAGAASTGTSAPLSLSSLFPSKPPSLWSRLWPAALIALLVTDLWLYGHNFNTAVDPRLLEFTPPVVEWLQSQGDPTQPWRLVTFDAPGEKMFNANTPMPYGLEDVRGYDSIIPRQYVAYMDRIQPQTELLYNRIAPIYAQWGDQQNYGALDNPLLNLLGVRYVVTTQAIPNPGYELAYDGEVKVYKNRNAFPRVFIVPEAVAAPDQAAALDTLQKVDPAEVVVVEGMAPGEVPSPGSAQLREARIARRGNREVFVDVNVSDRGWLVFTDNYFDGWKAYLRPFGVEGEGVNAAGKSIEEQLPIYRADGTFRAVYLPKAGQWTVRFVYSPRSFLVGLYTSFLAVVALLLLLGWWAWGRYYRGEGSEVGTVAKNSAVQIIMSLVNKGIDFVFAMLRLRVLGPSGEGSYAFAITFIGVFEILTRFGLGTLLTRDVATDRRQANRYLANVVGLRTLLWLLSIPLMFLVAAFYRVALNELSQPEALTIAIFALALLFANIADAISSMFIAFEKMEYPAGVSTAVAAGKIALGGLVILPPLDLSFVGLAGVSLVMNVVQVVWLYILLRRKVLPVGAQLGTDWPLQRYMLRESGPLMINHLLASVFWRIDLWVLKGFSGAAAVGIFSAGVKYLDGLNVIPSYFTLAIFPLMSRYAQAAQSRASGGKDSLAKAYRLAVQLLYIVALPVAVFVTFAATPLIRILGGAAYLPDSATALSIMIWSVPIGFVNSVTQYALIAVNQQRFLTKAFVVGVVFTSAANLIFVPRYGYLAASVILIPAELSLFIPFYWAVRRHVTPMPWVSLLWRPTLAAGLDAAVVWGLGRAGGHTGLLSLIAGFLVYAVALLALGTFRGDDFAVLRARLPRIRWLGGSRGVKRET